MIVFFLLTSLELASLESMASPEGEGLVYCNKRSVGRHLWTTQEWQRAVALLVSGAHLCSLTCVGFPFIFLVSFRPTVPQMVQLTGTSKTSSLFPSLSLHAKLTSVVELTLFDLTESN